jgi:hypothetical protein
MNPKSIEETLSKIIEIDMDAVSVELKTRELDTEKEKELKKRLREIEFEHMKKARKQGNMTYNDILKLASQEEAKVLEAGENEAKMLDKLMEEKKGELGKLIFKKLLDQKAGS